MIATTEKGHSNGYSNVAMAEIASLLRPRLPSESCSVAAKCQSEKETAAWKSRPGGLTCCGAEAFFAVQGLAQQGPKLKD